MNASFQTPLALVGRILLALLFLPAGLSKISGFSGTVGYIGSAGLPLPEVAAALAIVVEVGGAPGSTPASPPWRWPLSHWWPRSRSTPSGRCPPSRRWCSN